LNKYLPFKQKDSSLHCVALKMTMFLGAKAGLILAALLPISNQPKKRENARHSDRREESSFLRVESIVLKQKFLSLLYGPKPLNT
jgi:hypothetical protein